MSEKFDIVVIGSGPGGYVCAIRAAQLGLKTAIVEKYSTLGGTCLNVGCIPSKALLDSTERYYQTITSHNKHGIQIQNVEVDLAQMMKRVQDVVDNTCKGVQYLMNKNKIKVFHGHGSFQDANTILVKGEKEEKVQADKFVIATGSKPAELPFAKLDKERIISSTEALKLKEIPKHLVVIGGGIIGLELGSCYRRLGSQVSIIEYADAIIPTMDAELGRTMQRVLTKEGFSLYISHQVSSVSRDDNEVTIKAKGKKSEKEIELKGDYCLVSVGRKPYTEKLGLENIGIETDERGCIPINLHLQTKQPHIYAIGDVVRGAMLAHKAEEEGIMVAEFIAGQKPHINYLLIPNVVYTWPEIASVGYTEEELKEKNVEFKKGSFPFRALGRARAANESDGLVKVLTDKKTDEILGVHMIGPRCADMIAEGVLAMEYKASAEDIARISHAHPTYTEALKEACLAATENRPIHL